MKRLYLLLFVIIGLLMVPSVLSAPSCKVAVFNFDLTLVASGKVSAQGHFTPVLASLYPYTLWCPNSWPFDTGSVSFLYAVDNSTENGSGHVAIVGSGSTFLGEELLGFQDSCVINTACAIDESCIFRMSNESVDGSHVADCDTDDVPYDHSFTYRICCELGEVCNNGLDDDSDGFIDCADHDCNNLNAALPPEECTGSPLNSSYCAGPMNATCWGQPPPPSSNTKFYCSYGINDNPDDSKGACCPAGTFSELVENPPLSGNWEWQCMPTEECGIDLARPCNYDFFDNRADYLSSLYDSDPDDWCHSAVPELYSPGQTPDPKSAACCVIVKYSELGYYTDDKNVKIYG